MAGTTIIGSGRFAPGKPVSNKQLERVMDTDDAWIQKRTGIKQRHFASEGQGCSDLAVEAAKVAIDSAGLQPEDIDYIVFATMTPDNYFPGSGGLLGSKLGIAGVPALDIRQQCAAIPFGFQVADGLIAVGAAETVLLVGAEAHAGFMPWTNWDILLGDDDEARAPKAAFDKATRHRGLAILFGDGAGAFVLRKHEKPGHGLISAKLHTDGHGADQMVLGLGFTRRPYCSQALIDEEMHFPSMKGRELFKNAATLLPQVVTELCAEQNVSLDEVDMFIAHQANDRINGAVRKALNLPVEKVPSNIAKYGNTSAGTIPILFDELSRDGRVKPGDLICFLALGAGLNWGAALMRL